MQKLKYLMTVFVLIALLGSASGALASSTAVAPDLATAASFVGLAHETFTNTGAGMYMGNVGTSPGTSITGFPPGSIHNGALHIADGVSLQAMSDANAAYTALGGQSCNVNLTGQDLGGMTLTPAVYCFDNSAQLTGDLVLDALGNPHAVWVFKIDSTLTTSPDSSVTSSVAMINGGKALNVFWQVGSSATLDTGTRFMGNILAHASVTLNNRASLIGRAFGLTGSVTMDTTDAPFPIANTPMCMLLYLPIVKH